VGLTYKMAGQQKAIETGENAVQPHKDERVKTWIRLIQESPKNTGVVMCWRGGLRSKIATQWINEAGVATIRVEGGYKAVRLVAMERLQTSPSLLVLTGLTGTGKTKLLTEVSVPKIDLEGLAHHRGSSFGSDLFIPQPSQATFENRVATATRNGSLFLVEDESRRIGQCTIPPAMKAEMMRSPVVILESPIYDRTELIFDSYIRDPLLKGKLRQLDCISKQLGGALHQELRKIVAAAFAAPYTTFEAHEEWIRILLLRHYDARYRYAFDRLDRPVAFQGDYESCKLFLEWRLKRSGHFDEQPEMIRA
jgi:tRNA 2-selenouridine synthase